VESSWFRDEQKLQMRVVVPVGSVACVHVPDTGDGRGVRVSEGEQAIRPGDEGSVAGVLSCEETNGRVVLELGSGEYSLTIQPPEE